MRADRAPASRRRLRRVLIGLSTTVLALTGCSGPGAADPTVSAPTNVASLPTATPKRGGSVTMVLASLGARFDPAIQQIYAFTESPVMNAIFGNLLYQEPGSTEIKMGFLKSFTPSADSTVWTAVLIPGLKFSDGTDFDAAAIAFNIERAADPTVGSLWYQIAKDLDLEVVDATTLKITLPEPNSYFDYLFLEAFACIGSPTAIKAAGADFSTRPVGAGPFMYKSSVSGQSLTLQRNPYYELFAKDEPYLDEVVFQFLPSYPQQAAALKSGTAQLAFASGQRAVDDLVNTGVNTSSISTGGGGNFLFNTAVAPFDDVRARRAVTLALNRSDVASAFAPGSPPATNLFPESSPYYDPKYDFPDQDAAQAQALFDELAAEGKPVEFAFTALASFPDSMNTANYVQAQLATFKNVTVTVKGVPTPVGLTDKRTGNYQVYQAGLYVLNPVPEISEQFRTNGITNSFKWSNPAVDDAIAQIQRTNDAARQKELWGIVQEEFLKDVPVYFGPKGVIGFGATKDITGVHLIGLGLVPQWGSIGYVQ